jgi:hypothetical protein
MARYRQESFDTELEGFAHDNRGYSTHDAVRSHLHSPAVAR